MVFDDGSHAISWLVNCSVLLDYPTATTGKIVNMLKLGASMGSSSSENSVEVKMVARIDLHKLVCKLDEVDERFLVILVSYADGGMREATDVVKKGKAWAKWRRANAKNMANGIVTPTDVVYGVIDIWENLLIENGYMEG